MIGVGGALPASGYSQVHANREPQTSEGAVQQSSRLDRSGTAASRQDRLAPGGISESRATTDAYEPSATAEVASSDRKTTTNSSAKEEELTPEEKRQVQELRKRDREVRQHEAAHKAAAGQYARGAAQFSYQTGPDGRRYAVGGEVSVDISPIPGDPEATIQKMNTVRRAALAPKDPSAADHAAAAQAARTAATARQEMVQEKAQDTNASSTEDLPSDSAGSADGPAADSPVVRSAGISSSAFDNSAVGLSLNILA